MFAGPVEEAWRMSLGMSRVLTVTTNPALDVAITVDALVPDHKLRATHVRREPGGGGVNVARVLARFGVDVQAAVAVGGAVGDELIRLIEADGVMATAIRIEGSTRESIAITDASDARQYRLVLPGPTIDDADAFGTTIAAAATSADWVVCSGSLAPGLPIDFHRGLSIAVSPAQLILDVSGAALGEAVRGDAFLIKPSRRELASLLSWTPATEDEIEIGAREVLARGSVENLVVSLGPSGALLVRDDGPTQWFRPPPVEVNSTVGAGDAMVAGIVSGLVDGLDVTGAVRRGIAAGSATASSPGTALCSASAALALAGSVTVMSGRRG